MSQIDLEVNRAVRRVLVRHWIDIGRLFFRSANGALSIRGLLMRIAGIKDDLTPSGVQNIMAELKRIKQVKRISVDLDNWVEEAGSWKERDKGKETSTGREIHGRSNKTYILDKQSQSDQTS